MLKYINLNGFGELFFRLLYIYIYIYIYVFITQIIIAPYHRREMLAKVIYREQGQVFAQPRTFTGFRPKKQPPLQQPHSRRDTLRKRQRFQGQRVEDNEHLQRERRLSSIVTNKNVTLSTAGTVADTVPVVNLNSMQSLDDGKDEIHYVPHAPPSDNVTTELASPSSSSNISPPFSSSTNSFHPQSSDSVSSNAVSPISPQTPISTQCSPASLSLQSSGRSHFHYPASTQDLPTPPSNAIVSASSETVTLVLSPNTLTSLRTASPSSDRALAQEEVVSPQSQMKSTNGSELHETYKSLPTFIYKYHFPDPPNPPEHLRIKEPAPEEGARERVLEKVTQYIIELT